MGEGYSMHGSVQVLFGEANREFFWRTLEDSRRAQRGWLVRLVELSRCAALLSGGF